MDYKGCTISIAQDENPQSPNEWGNEELFLVGYHRDFTVKRDKIITKSDAVDIVNCEGDNSHITDKYYCFGLEAYIHSGVVLALSQEGSFPDRQWDVSQLGLVLVSKLEFNTKEKARKAALSLIEEWNDYLSGNVWGFMVRDKNSKLLDSCWGFYGDEGKEEALKEAKEHVDYYINEELKIDKITHL